MHAHTYTRGHKNRKDFLKKITCLWFCKWQNTQTRGLVQNCKYVLKVLFGASGNTRCKVILDFEIRRGENGSYTQDPILSVEQRGGTVGYSTSMYGCQQNWVTGVYWYMAADRSSRVSSGLYRLHTSLKFSQILQKLQAHNDAKLQKETKIFSGFSSVAQEIPTFHWLKTNQKVKDPQSSSNRRDCWERHLQERDCI